VKTWGIKWNGRSGTGPEVEVGASFLVYEWEVEREEQKTEREKRKNEKKAKER